MKTIVARAPLDDLRIVGGNLALDFVNTRSGPRGGPADTEWLSSYADFAAWSRRPGVAGLDAAGPAPRPTAPAAGAPAAGAPAAGAPAAGAPAAGAPAAGAPAAETVAAFARVQASRDDIDEIFRALAEGAAPPDPALRRLQLAYLEALARGRLAADAEGYSWAWGSGGDLLAPLWPIVAAAVELLTARPAGQVKPGQVKPCQACRFLFIDQSKNGSRRWCSMEDCGKAAKIARYLQRRADAQAR
jgi:predicted RNA-binding Zn ribbon-like protein